MRILKKENMERNINSFIFIAIVLTASILRLFNLDWDQGHYLHPDERLFINSSNLSFTSNIELLLKPESPLNPNMFYYGSLPLYIYKFVNVFIFPKIDILLVSRLISSISSILTIFVLYAIALKLFSRKVALLSSLFFCFSIGSIQHAHFNTTESLLILILSLVLYLSILFYKNESKITLAMLGIVSGLGVGTKITALTFLLIPSLVFLNILLKRRFKALSLYVIIFSVLFCLSAVISSPYQLIDWGQFFQEQSYMQGVILGKSKPPFVIIYENSMPYIYPLIKVMPFIFGFVTLPLSISGFFILIHRLKKDIKGEYIILILVLFPLLYFVWSGSWYAKFSRYYLLLLPFVCITAAVAFEKIRSRILMITIILLVAANGLAYLKVYLLPHTRIAASTYIYKSIPQGKIILGEHWDDNLPLPNSNFSNITYKLDQLTVYDADNTEKARKMADLLSSSDYFIISSRRVYQSILSNKNLYPYTYNFYHNLFNGSLGYSKEKEFINSPFFISDNFADESFQSYDHPPVIIFKNSNRLKEEVIYSILTNGDKQ